MTVSEIVKANLIESEGIEEIIGTYNSGLREFLPDMELNNTEGDHNIYKRHGEYLFVHDYDSAREDPDNPEQYKMYDLVWKDDMTQYVSNTTGKAIKQPWEYDDIDSGVDQRDWDYRYTEVGHITSDNGSPLGIRNPDFAEEGDMSITVLVYFYTDDVNERLEVYQAYTKDSYETIFDGDDDDDDTDDYCYMTSDGNIHVKNGSYEKTIPTFDAGDGWYITTEQLNWTQPEDKTCDYVYKIGDESNDYPGQYEFNWYEGKIGKQCSEDDCDNVFNLLRETKTGSEQGAYAQDTEGFYLYNNVFVNRLGEDDVYVYLRTRNSLPVEYKDVDDFVYSELKSIDEIDWGWTFYRPTREYAPFDDKNYTYLVEDNTVVYKVRSLGDFDILAFNGVVASEIKVEVYDEDDETILETKSYIPRSVGNLSGKEKIRPDVGVIYLDDRYPKGRKLVITLEPLNGYLRLGGGYLGDKNIVGFTNLEFTNEIIDYNYYEKDDFGNIVYTGDKNVKVRKMSGTADIKLVEYDDVEPVLRELLSNKVIVDGSDNWENKTPDSFNYFSSSMIIGRIRSVQQKTKLTNEKLDNLATYSFTIEEDI